MDDVLEIPIPVDLGKGLAPIVMVDDEEPDRELVRRYYKRSGLSNPLLQFFDGPSFLAYLEETDETGAPLPAVVLMDINMPRLNGFETVGAMRRDARFNTLPVVMMLTSSNDPRDRERATAAGANGYLLKPFNPSYYLDFFRSLNEDRSS